MEEARERLLARDALKRAFEENYPRLLRLCVALSRNREVGEDMAQDAFVRLSPVVESLAPQEIWPYLRRIAVNLWKDRLRRLRIEARHISALRSQQTESVAPETDERDRVWRALARLPDRQRACVVLRYYEDLPEREVAAILGCSPGAVKGYTSRALARLREELEHGDR